MKQKTGKKEKRKEKKYTENGKRRKKAEMGRAQ
jgi:hypothetical protein